MKINNSALIVILLAALSVLLHFSCGKNTGSTVLEMNENKKSNLSEILYTDESEESIAYINITESKAIETDLQSLLPPQEVLRKWFLLGYYELYREFSDTEKLKQYSQAVFDFMQMEINTDYPSPDQNGWTLEAIKKAAKEYFYLDDFDAEYIPEENGIYSIGAHGGMVRMYDFIGEPETDGEITKITVQFYADSAKTVKSHTIIYTLNLKDRIYRFAASERIYDSQFEPYGFSM